MKEITLNILDKVKLSYRWQSNVLFTAAIVLITSGANALSGNWIIVALGIVSEQFFNKPIENYDIFFGIILLLLGFYFIYLGLEALKIMNHDRPKYHEFKDLANFQLTRNILDQIKTHFFYLSDQDTHLYNIQHFIEQPENSYLTKSMNKQAKVLRDRLNDFLLFRGVNFFVYPSHQTQQNFSYGLQPGLDINKELRVFDQRKADRLEIIRNELIRKTESVETALTDLILKTRNKLGIS